MASEAERLLAASGWLPEPLRLAEQVTTSDVETTDGTGESLPAFLIEADVEEDNSGSAATDDDEQSYAVAAE